MDSLIFSFRGPVLILVMNLGIESCASECFSPVRIERQCTTCLYRVSMPKTGSVNGMDNSLSRGVCYVIVVCLEIDQQSL